MNKHTNRKYLTKKEVTINLTCEIHWTPQPLETAQIPTTVVATAASGKNGTDG
jgi:hypothetical protein